MLERIKPLTSLVNEILDQLPKEVWTSDTTRFFDPAIGGGQFVSEVERRLRAAGHTDANIHSRVFGFEHTMFLISTATNMNGLVGNYTKMDYESFFTLDESMKFDVVLGNPPFQAKTEDGDRKDPGSNLWTQFLVKCFSLTKDNGYLAMISPDAWVTPYSEETTGGRKNGRETRKIFRENQIVWLNYRECGKHFRGVGSAFTAYVIQKSQPVAPTRMVLLNEGQRTEQETNLAGFFWLPITPTNTVMSIVDKVFWKTTNYKSLTSCGTRDASSLTKDKTHKYPFYVAASTMRYATKAHQHLTKKKVVIPALSTKENAVYDAGTCGPVLNGVNIQVASDEEGNNLLGIVHSKVVQFCLKQSRWHHGYQMTYVLQNIPAVDCSRTWTDDELYAHFSLTKKEIDCIESYFTQK